MTTMMKSILAGTAAIALVACAAPSESSGANSADKETVQKFYDFLSNPGSESHAEAFKAATTAGWESIGNYSGKNKNKQAFTGQVGGFGKLMPDLKWAVQDIHQDGNVVTVRSRATGTPKGPLFGVNGEGQSFDILTIDIHELEGGKIARSYHVEDWAGALQQLTTSKAQEAKMAAAEGQKTLAVAEKFLMAAGSGDGATLMELMADDFVWHNEGDPSVPWIGNWEGKKEVMGTFMPKFGAGLKVTSWSTDYKFASGNQAVFVGSMSAIANNTGVDTGKFSWVVRVHVENGKVKSWNWFEDSFAVSQAYHGK